MLPLRITIFIKEYNKTQESSIIHCNLNNKNNNDFLYSVVFDSIIELI